MQVPEKLEFDGRIKNGKISKPHVHKRGMTIVFVDTETKINYKSDNAADYLKLGVLCEATYNEIGEIVLEAYTHFTTIEQLHNKLTEILKKHNYINLVAHNINFDFQVMDLLKWLESQDLECEVWYQEMSVSYIHWQKDKTIVRILDNMNWWPMALKQVGKVVNEEKMDIDFEKCSLEELAIYCEQDVRIMVKGMSVFWKLIFELYGLRPRWTLGSTAMNCFLSTPSRSKLIQNRIEDVGKDAIRSYVGGRVEVFRLGEFKNTKLFKLDVNSLYPTVMAKEKYPVEYLYTMDKPKINHIKLILKSKICCADCEVKTKENVFPYQLGKRKIYPLGTYRTWLTGNEFKYGIENGLITKVHKMHVYRAEYIFTEYVNKLYLLKQEFTEKGNWGGREVCKRLLNSLYGKFAQVGFKKEFVKMDYKQRYVRGKFIEENPEDNWKFEVLNYKMYKLNKNVILPHSMPIIASCVTANARQYMWTIFKEIGLENCYYSDTDSIITNEIGLENVKNRIDDLILGGLKNEGESDYLQVWGAKAYVWGDKRTIKGIPYRAYKINDNTFQYTGFRTLNNLVFKNNSAKEFELIKERKIRELIPDGYQVIGSKVYPPTLYDGLL